MKSGKYLTDQYLEFRLEKADGSLREEEVDVFFERDTGNALLDNRLFLVFKHWNDLGAFIGTPSFADKTNSLPYNEVEVVFDVCSVDCAALSNPLSKGYQKAEIKIKKTVQAYLQDNNQLTIKQSNDLFSGVGQIFLYSNLGGQRILKGKYFLAINNMRRIKIDYSIANTSTGVDVTLKCKNPGACVSLLLLDNPNRLPCLTGDRASTTCPPQTADFSNGEARLSFALPPNKRNGFYALAFANEEDENLYLLNLIYEDSFGPVNAGAKEIVEAARSCPYCGRKLRDRRVVTAYEEGSICCSVLDSRKILPKIYDRSEARLRHAIFCQDDLDIQGERLVFQPQFMRLLPPEYYDKQECRIALLGSTRAGKTTFLSRFFGLTTSSGQASMNVRHLSNALAKFGISVTAAKMPEIEPTGDGGYRIQDKDYFASSRFYIDRSIDLASGSFPMATPSGTECGRYPFALDVEGNGANAYVNFYDIPGEDARNKAFKGFVPGECSGVFVFINAIRDIEGNAAVINALKNAKLPKDTPIAIILSKSDLAESKFDSSAHVRRADYYDIDCSLPYEKGLGREIACASMEVKSYMQSESMILNLDSEFDNVMYFALSSFNFSEAIRHHDEKHNEPGRLQFDDGTKRMELPLIWMLKQFGFLKMGGDR